MQQVLLEIPVPGLDFSVRIFGYGAMLVVALFVGQSVAARFAERYGGKRELIYDVALVVFFAGLVGARIFYVVQKRELFDRPWIQFFEVWKGGLVIYGGTLGALIGFLWCAYRYQLSLLWLLDVSAPAMMLGLGIGRMGCLLNGCCYGDYCDAPWGVSFPPNSAPFVRMVEEGRQSPVGFGIIGNPNQARVSYVEPGTDADRTGVRPGQRIRIESDSPSDDKVAVSVDRSWGHESLHVGLPRSLPLHPTQVYSFVKGAVLFLVLSALFPYRRRDGEITSWMAILYAPSRFAIEALRHDELPVFAGMTIAQVISVLVFCGGLAGMMMLRRRPVQYR